MSDQENFTEEFFDIASKEFRGQLASSGAAVLHLLAERHVSPSEAYIVLRFLTVFLEDRFGISMEGLRAPTEKTQ